MLRHLRKLDRPERVLAALTAAMVLVVALSHFVAVQRCPLQQYGVLGAEYTEHAVLAGVAQRSQTISLVEQILLLPLHLAHQDGEYPALLHVLASWWGRVFGDGLRGASHLDLLFVPLLVAATALFARDLARWNRADEARAAIYLAVCGLLLCPAIFATARRYYYDLPATAWCMVTLVAVVRSPRSAAATAVVALATAAALLTKWTSGIYLLPIWAFGIVQVCLPGRERGRLRPLIRLALAGVVAFGLCLPSVLVSRTGRDVAASLHLAQVHEDEGDGGGRGSLDHIFSQAADGEKMAGGQGLLQRPDRLTLRFYRKGLVEVCVGALLLASLVLAAGVGFRGWRSLGTGALLCVVPLIIVAGSVDIWDERFLLPMLPWIVAAVAAAWTTCAWPWVKVGTLGVVVLAGLLQLGSVDGHLSLPESLAPRAPMGERGWSVARHVRCSPDAALEQLVRAACEAQQQGGEIWVQETVAAHDGWQYHARRSCLDLESILEFGGGGPPAKPHRAPLAVVTSGRLDASWPAPVDSAEVMLHETATAYLFWIE